MRRTLALLLSLTLIVTCTIAGVVLPTSAEETEAVNMIANGDFEGFGAETPVVKPWTSMSSESWEIAQGNGYKGSWGAKVLAASGLYLKSGANYKLEEGTYRFAYKVKTNDKQKGDAAYVDIQGFQNCTGTYIGASSKVVYPQAYASAGQWQYCYADFRVSDIVEGKQAHLQGDYGFYLKITADAVGMCFDEFELYKIDDYSKRDILVGGDFEGAVDQSLFGSTALNANYTMLSKSNRADLIAEPGNESNHVMRLKAIEGGWTSVYPRGLKAESGKSYLLTFDYKGSAFTLHSETAYGSYGVATPVSDVRASNADEWTAFGVVVNSASGAGNWLFSFEKRSAYDHHLEDTYIDNMRLVEYVAPESVELSASALTVEKGESADLNVSFAPETATKPFVKWTSSDASVATVKNGKVTALAQGSATITANVDGFEAMTCEVTVPKPKATGIQFDNATVEVVQSGYIKLTATPIPAEADLPAITWTSSNEKVAKVEDGVVYGVKVGTATITATAEGLAPVTCTVTVHNDAIYTLDFEDPDNTDWIYAGRTGVAVEDPSDPTNHVLSVTGTGAVNSFLINDIPFNVKKGDRYAVRIRVKQIGKVEAYTSGRNIVGAWYKKGSTSDPLAIASIPWGAKSTTRHYIADEWITIQTTLTAPNDDTVLRVGFYVETREGTETFLFDDFEVIKINPDVNLMPNGNFEDTKGKQQYMYRYFQNGELIKEADGNTILHMTKTSGEIYFQLTGCTSTARLYELSFRYKSTGQLVPYTPNSTMFEPDEGTGDKYTYFYPATTGDEWGYAKYYFSGGNAQYNMSFQPKGHTIYFDDVVLRELDFADGMTINKTEAEVLIGETVDLSVSETPEYTYLKPVAWTTSDAAIATVENGVVTTKGIGEVTITATSGDFTQTCVINVKPIAVTDVTLDIAGTVLTVGDTATLNATVLPENATDKTVTWTTSNDAVATVDGGVITAVGAGVATITAKAGDVEATCTVTVRTADYPIIGGAFVGTVGEASGFTYVTEDETTNGTDVLLEGDETNQYIVIPAKGTGALKSGAYSFDMKAGIKYDMTFKASCTGNDGRIKWHVITYKEGVQVEDLMGITEVRNKDAGKLYTYHGLFTPNKDADSFVLTFEMSQTGTSSTMQPHLDDLKLVVGEDANITVTNGDFEGTTSPTFKGTYTKANNLCVEENGNHYLLFNSGSGDNTITTPKIYGNFKAGVRYLVRMKVKNPGVDSAKLCMYFYGTHKNGGGSTPIYTPTVSAGTTEWTEVQFWVNCFATSSSINGFYTATSGAVDTNGDGAKTPEIWLDDITITEAPYGDSSINLMPDGDMSVNNMLWNSDYTTYVQDPDDPTNRVVKFGANASGNYCTGGKYINFGEVSHSTPEKGQIYKLTWWQKGTGTVTPDVYSYCTKLVAYGNPGAASKEWKKITYYFSAGGSGGQNMSYMALLRFYSGDVYIDNVELYEVSNALEISMPDGEAVAGKGDVKLATFPENAYPGKVTFSTDATKVEASVGSSSGVVTAMQGSAADDTFTVTATSDILGTATGTYKITYPLDLVVGGDFEDSYYNGAAWKDHKNMIVEDTDGNTMVKYTDLPANYSAHYYKGALYFQPNATYKVTFKVKGKGKAMLSMTNTTGVSVSGDYLFESATEVTEWKEQVAYITTGAAPHVSLSGESLNQGWQFHTRNESKNEGDSVCFDDIRITLTGRVEAPEYVENGEIEVEATEDVAAETEVTVEVTPDEGYIMKPGSLKYTTPDGKVYKVLNKELNFNPENFGSREFTGDTFTFTMPKDSVALDAEFIPTSVQNFAVDTVGTGLRQTAGGEYDGIRFLTRMNVAFSFNDVADAAELELGLKYNGKDYTVKEIGSMIVRDNGIYDLGAMDPTDASTYWRKSVAYKAGADMTLLDYTNRYIDFTVVVTKGANIEEEDFAARRYTAQGYLILTDGDEDIIVKCDNALTNSVNGAKGIVA